MSLSWMAWTWQTATFFVAIALLLIGMGVWERFSPGAGPRRGILGIHTTRGDRLFISLLLAAYIHLLWLGATRLPLWGASIAALIAAVLVFRKA